MEKFSCSTTNDKPMELPPGFRFHPTDEELITHYLSHKVLDTGFITKAIGEVDLNKVEPWDLPWKAKMGEKEWYFFCLRDRKYPTGFRTNRATEAGYWKATGKDREIFREKFLIGMKKTLVFYGGRAPRGKKTNWVMHEYRLEGKHSTLNLPKTAKTEWVISRVFKKTRGGKKVHISELVNGRNCGADLPPLMEMSSDENHVRNAAELYHETCLSNPMENSRDKLFEEFSSSSSKNCDFSPTPFTFPQVSTSSSILSSQFIPQTESLNDRDSVLMQDQTILRLLIDDNVTNTTQNAEAEASEGMAYHDAGFKPYDDQEFPFVSTAPIDLDCLWDY